MIECKHWTQGEHATFGICGIGLFGGRPSLGTCRRCEFKNREASKIADIIAQQPPVIPMPPPGPGTELKKLLAEIGITPSGCGCDGRALQMDQWGVAGCVEHREEIIGWLTDAAKERGWFATILARKFALAWMVDEAIGRAQSPKE